MEGVFKRERQRLGTVDTQQKMCKCGVIKKFKDNEWMPEAAAESDS